LRPAAVNLVRALPPVRGRGRLASVVNAAFLKAGAEPAAVALMSQGHKLLLDCRLFSHAHALFSGKYDDHKVKALAAFIRQGGTALDVGANIGFYTVPLALAARRVGAHVVAAEPFANNLARLRQNLELNDVLDYVTVLDFGLSSEAKSEWLALTDDFQKGATIGNAAIADANLYGDRFERVRIRLAALDAVWAALGRPRLDAVKLDIEGHEDSFLEGAVRTLREHRPVILIEVNRWFYERRSLDFDSCIAALLPPAYRVFEVTRGKVKAVPGLAEVCDSDALLVPAEKSGALPL